MGSSCCKKRGEEASKAGAAGKSGKGKGGVAKTPGSEDPATNSTQATEGGRTLVLKLGNEENEEGYICFNKVPRSDRTENTQAPSPPPSKSKTAPATPASAPFPVTEDESTDTKQSKHQGLEEEFMPMV